MKTIKLFGFALITVLLCVSLSSCSKSDDDGGGSSSNPLVGTWRAEIVEKGEVQYWEMTFNANFTFSYKEYNKDDNSIIHNSGNGTYKFKDDTTIIINNSTTGETYSRRFKITDGNKFEFLDFDHGIIYHKIN